MDEASLMRRLIEDEGEVLHVYPDLLGFSTIGVGRLIDQRKGGGISHDESRYLLRNDIASKTAQCERRFEWFVALDGVRQGIIICMAFQLGVNGVANFKKMIAAIEARDWSEAAMQMMDSGWHTQTSERCERMARMMRVGVWE
jgi:lysozyme